MKPWIEIILRRILHDQERSIFAGHEGYARKTSPMTLDWGECLETYHNYSNWASHVRISKMLDQIFLRLFMRFKY